MVFFNINLYFQILHNSNWTYLKFNLEEFLIILFSFRRTPCSNEEVVWIQVVTASCMVHKTRAPKGSVIYNLAYTSSGIG